MKLVVLAGILKSIEAVQLQFGSERTLEDQVPPGHGAWNWVDDVTGAQSSWGSQSDPKLAKKYWEQVNQIARDDEQGESVRPESVAEVEATAEVEAVAEEEEDEVVPTWMGKNESAPTETLESEMKERVMSSDAISERDRKQGAKSGRHYTPFGFEKLAKADCPGHDLVRKGVPNMKSASACEQECLKNDQCMVYVWCVSGDKTTCPHGKHACYLKDVNAIGCTEKAAGQKQGHEAGIRRVRKLESAGGKKAASVSTKKNSEASITLPCSQANTQYGPFFGENFANGPADCQAQCADLEGCAYFTYIKEDKKCQFSDSSASAEQVDGATSGPALCASAAAVERASGDALSDESL